MKREPSTEKRLQEALRNILNIATSVTQPDADPADTNDSGDQPGTGAESEGSTDTPAEISCSIKQLPKRLWQNAADEATKINPVNAPLAASMAELSVVISDPLSLTLLTSKYWGPTPRRLTVSFMESQPADLRARILRHMNAWTQTGCISFVQTTGVGNVRISTRPGGYWSYLGTDILLIPQNRPTMNLQGFTMNTSESEFKRVVRHETGHTLGFPHEHMRRELVQRIDPQKAYEYFLRTQGWNKQTVDQQVLTPLNDATIIGTPPDQTSIMCYQLPGSITRDGRPILGGTDINATDFAFVRRIYPKPGAAPFATSHFEEWNSNEDITSQQIEATVRDTVYSDSEARELVYDGQDNGSSD
jgi:hypothetical protein